MTAKKKIIVIADDFTGAAEIGGIGLRNGLKVAIETAPIDNADKDIVVVATDTRSMTKEDAAVHMTKVTEKLQQFDPLLIYKKIDSVLRGNVAEELVAQMKAMGKERAIIIAANPAFNRIIKNGKYYIDGIPLDKTRFSNDHQFPIRTNDVLKLLNIIDGVPVVNLKPEDPLPDKGLIVGDVENLDDLHKWALKYDEDTLLAGAFGFFDTLLKCLNYIDEPMKSPSIPFGPKAMFILGSSYPKEKKELARMVDQGHFHANMPEKIYYDKEFDPILLENWARDIITNLEGNRKVIVSSLHKDSKEANISYRIKKVIAQLIKNVFDNVKINEILIEGGSTTSEILDQLDIKKLTPIQELGTGVIRMKVDRIPDLYLTTKPGSYKWPRFIREIGEETKHSYTNNNYK